MSKCYPSWSNISPIFALFVTTDDVTLEKYVNEILKPQELDALGNGAVF